MAPPLGMARDGRTCRFRHRRGRSRFLDSAQKCLGVIMFALFFIGLACQPLDYDGISLSDANNFAWIGKQVAHEFYVWSSKQQQEMYQAVVMNNPPHVADSWLAECHWRKQCWDKLDDVLWCTFPTPKKIQSLAELRQLLGHSDYYAGKMPWPVVNYR